MKRTRILHIISSLKIGGAEAVLVDLLRHLPSDQYEHHVLYFHDGPNRLPIQALGIATYQVTGYVFQYDIVFVMRLYRLIKHINPDVILSSLWAASLFARIMGPRISIPVICGVHAEVSHHGRLRNLLDYYTWSYAHAIVAVSEGVAASLKAQFGNELAQKIVLIKNGIDVIQTQNKQKQQSKDRSSLGLRQDHFVIGAVGRFVPVKSYDTLIAACAHVVKKHENVRLLLIGMGPLEEALRAQVAALGLETQVTFIIGESAAGYYGLMDCFVLPSLQEGLSIALLEAIVSKAPCIVTSSVGIHPVIENYVSGLIIRPAEVFQLVEAIDFLIINRDLKAQMGDNAYSNVIKNFSIDRAVNSYSNLIDSVIQGEIIRSHDN